MTQPPGFVDAGNPTAVCKLQKAIYGLKQAPRAWFNELKNYLLAYGFTSSLADPSLFILHHASHPIFLLVYVDDIVVTGPSPNKLSTFITSLATRFSIKDLGSLSYFLGIEVTPNKKGFLLSQSKYIHDLLDKFKMLDSKPSSTPMLVDPPLLQNTGTPPCDLTKYRSAVGSLQYLSFTRPDISYSVNKLAQFMQAPQEAHLTALKRLLRYLHGTMHLGLQIIRDSTRALHSFSDADWGGDKDNYFSTSGYLVYMGRNLLSWSLPKSKKSSHALHQKPSSDLSQTQVQN
mgnify:FL=1